MGTKGKRFNTIIALVFGAAVVFPHILWGTLQDPTDARLVTGQIDVVEVINNSLPSVSVIIVAILCLLLIFGIWGSKVRLGENSLSGVIAIFAFAAVIYIFGSAANWWTPLGFFIWNGAFLGGPDTQALVVTILVFAVIIWFITKDEEKEKPEGRFGKFFGDVLKGDED